MWSLIDTAFFCEFQETANVNPSLSEVEKFQARMHDSEDDDEIDEDDVTNITDATKGRFLLLILWR